MRLLLTTIFSILTIAAFSQLTLSEVGRSEPILSKKKKDIIMGSEVTVYNNDCYVLKISKYKNKKSLEYETGTYQLMHFDSTLQLLNTKDIGINFRRGVIYKSKNSEIGLLGVFNDQLIIGVVERNKKKKKAEIFIHLLNPKTLAATQPPKKVLEIDFKGWNKTSGDFGFSVSPDQSKLLVYGTRTTNKNYEMVTKAFDEKLEPLWEKKLSDDFELPKTPPVKQTLINDAGSAYFLLRAKKHEDKRFIRITDAAFDHVPIDDYRIKHLKMGFDQHQQLSILGFYTSIGKKTDGVIQIKLDDKKEKLDFDISYSALPEEFHEVYKRKTKGLKKPKGEDLLMVSEIFQKENGNWVVMGHSVYSNTFRLTSDRNDRTVYFYRNIIAIEVTPSGDIAGQQKIPFHRKLGDNNPYVKNTPTLGFLFFPYSNKVNFIFQDHVANFNYSSDRKIEFTSTYSDNQLVLYSLDPQAEIDKSILYSKQQHGISNLFSIQSRVLGKDKVLLFIRMGKKIKMVQMKVEG